jgi:glutamate N-acetyltransferase/amino-acid N-acetyltransferase
VIGEILPVDKINLALPELIKNLSSNSWLDAAKAIMTTDTIPKAVSKEIVFGDTVVTITGIVKGSGMIRPDMATMLAFIATDVNINKDLLDKILLSAVNKSFNRITVDGDTSTNDSCVLISTSKAKNKCINDEATTEYKLIESEVVNIFCELAQAIIRDGEGATKFLTIEVKSGKNEKECLAVAYKIAESPLVKTAFTASDPNRGECNEKIWTTDLSHEYIRINAEYRT